MSSRKKVKTNEAKPLSRRFLVCGECSKVLDRYDRLKPHFDAHHEGRVPFEKGQKKLDLFGSPPAKRTFSQDENLSEASHSGTPSDEPLSSSGYLHPVADKPL